ncbi:flagellar basal body rod C-terminal domain-containing protein [Deferrisoma camini]|uniref:flagellar basal body rod C-terminal domain-containing protein n=1 Tax=Deferrisoma camini TaxID=1035120 RepID=UPI00046D3282|nr:flagellar basal body rod C-terminal domain-containing protein [Deferrisoma camini]
MVSALYSALSGVRARQAQVDAAARNTANVSTRGYKRVEVTFSETPSGVRAEAVRSDAPGVPVPPEPPETEPAEGSNVDLVQETVRMIEGERGFEANLQVLRTQDEMLGTLLDRKG